MEIIEQASHLGTCSMFRYHDPSDESASKQTLFVVHNNRRDDESAMGWFVACGSWEAASIPDVASELKRKIADLPPTAKSTSAGDSLIKMRAILDGTTWKLYIDFLSLYPATVSVGQPGRWRFYLGPLQEVVDLLECFEAIGDAEERTVDCAPYTWFIPSSCYQLHEADRLQPQAAHFDLIQNAIAGYAKSDDEACQVFTKVLQHHLDQMRMEVAVCRVCSKRFVRSIYEPWRTADLDCYMREKSKSSAGARPALP
jgi:hypothetical protein